MTTSFDRMMDEVRPAGLYGAASLLAFAEYVLRNDQQQDSRWVVHAAINAAKEEIRCAVDEGDDMNVVAAKTSAISLRVGMASIEERINAGPLLDEGDGSADRETAKALRDAGREIFKLAFAAEI